MGCLKELQTIQQKIVRFLGVEDKSPAAYFIQCIAPAAVAYPTQPSMQSCGAPAVGEMKCFIQ